MTKAIEMAAPLLEQRNHALQVSVERGLLIDGDDVRLAQVFANLLNNAANYWPSGGRVRVSGRDIVIEIHEDGRGIPAELQPRLFTPFVQASQNSDRAEGGLGLRLAMANSIVESHRGSISAHSAGAGKGSTFIVTLPHANGQRIEAAPPGKPLQPSAAAPARQFLIVDDHEDAAELLSLMLEKHGHRVGIALDPVKALEAARMRVPDIAFIDIGLPVMDGYELAAHQRNELGTRCPLLVAVTGYGQARDRERSAAASFALHLVKPVQQASVLDALKRLTFLMTGK